MTERIKQISEAFGAKISGAETLGDLNNIKIKYLGKNGEVTEL